MGRLGAARGGARRSAAVALVLAGALLAAGCEDADPAATDASASPSTGSSASPSTGSSASPSTTGTASPSGSATDGATRVTVAPAAPLVGVALGTEADPAVADLTAALGEPGEDTGWVEGCPLDAPGRPNERFVTWGPLQANFLRGQGDGEVFSSWVYRLADVTADGVQPEQVELPGGVALGATVTEVVDATGLTPEPSETFGTTFLDGGGFELLGEGLEDDAPVTTAAVPFQPLCE